MAEIVLSPLLQVIFEKLASPVLQMLADRWDLNENFQKVQQTLPRIQSLLQDAEDRQVTDRTIRTWLSQLKDTVDEAEELLEQFTRKATLHASSTKSGWTYGEGLPSVTKVKEVLKALEMAANEGLSNLFLKEDVHVNRWFEGRETGSFVIAPKVFGRDEDREKIVDLLLTILPDGNVCVVPIVGIGGIGKTTLAQLAFNDLRVVQHFELRLWVFVSEEFNVKKIMNAIIESATGSRCDLSEMNMLQSKLWNTLYGKRYLLVLDDVWNEDQDYWDNLWSLLQGGTSGSKIIVTTRSQKVTMIIETSPNFTHCLKGLLEADCWILFKSRAFYQGEEDQYPNLLEIGKDILMKCGGLPLAVRTLGSLMRFRREEKEWLFVRNSELWNLEGCQQKGILPALMLSYLQLPSHLKHCFAFCSVFPRNYEINKEKLILVWMAEGMIPAEGDNRPLEDIGDECFRELSWMSFFEEIINGNEEERTFYKMHDLMHDLARYITRNESIILEPGLIPINLSQIRHLSSVGDGKSYLIPEDLHQPKHLRTLLLLGGGSWKVPPYMLASLTYVRVLDFSGCDFQFPDSLGVLMSLKYLDLSNTRIDKLPLPVSSIHSLQTLNLSGCYNLQHLPDLELMTCLRHLNLAGCEKLTTFPSGIETLVHIQTLPLYIVPIKGGLAALGSLNLRGELSIRCLENVRCKEDAQSADLIKKALLESLGLCWTCSDTAVAMAPDIGTRIARLIPRKRPRESIDSIIADILACLQPHQNLKRLSVVGYPGPSFPHWILPKLSTVVLTNCTGCLNLPTLGHLPLLKVLQMERISKVRSVDREFYGEGTVASFPSLDELVISDFPALQVWSNIKCREVFPKLRILTLKKCPNLIIVPHFPSLRHLDLHKCNPEVLRFIGKSTLLLTIVIQGFSELTSLPGELLGDNPCLQTLKIISCPMLQFLHLELEKLCFLKTLTISWCEKLSFLPKGFENLTSLETLEISDCHSLTSLSGQISEGLSSLRTLSIENCSNLSSIAMSFQSLTAMEHLTIMYCPSLSALPNGLHHLSSLRSLTILSCPQLGSLPEELKHVTSLQTLEIRSCSISGALPDWFESFSSLRSLAISDCNKVTSLPRALESLTALQHLSIHQCPVLQRRCQQNGGADWWKIAHIPHKYISSSQSRQCMGPSSSST